MPADVFVPQPMWDRIQGELDAIERDNQVRILLAVESGSRAWRFPSPDSDYDARFIYVRARPAYLSIAAPRDVIERPTDGVLDLNGWDIRKALQLMLRSNAVVIEWLGSPVRYREAGGIGAALTDLAHRASHPPALAYHYDRLARHQWDGIRQAGGAIPFKRYCYALRAALALQHIRRHASPPPMAMPELLSGSALDADVRMSIEDLIRRKFSAGEGETCGPVPALNDFLETLLGEPASRFDLPDGSMFLSDADAAFDQALSLCDPAR